MSKPTTVQERKFIEKKAEEGLKAEEIAAQLGISIKTVYKWCQLQKKGVRLHQKWDDLPEVH